jgi:hypothetical protein
MARVRELVKTWCERETEVLRYVPEALRLAGAEAEALVAVVEALPAEKTKAKREERAKLLAEAKRLLGAAEDAVAGATMPVKLRHLSDAQHQRIAVAGERAEDDWRRTVSDRGLIERQYERQLGLLDDEAFFEQYLTMIGRGASHADPQRFETVRGQLQAVAERLREQAPVVLVRCGEPLAEILGDVIAEVERAAVTADEGEWLDRPTIVYPSEQESAELAAMAEDDSPAGQAALHEAEDEVVKRHYAMELAKCAAEREGWLQEARRTGRAALLGGMIERLLVAQAQNQARAPREAAEMIAAMTLGPVDDTQLEGEWEPLFESVEEVELLACDESGADLYRWLCARIGEILPTGSRAQQVAQHAIFREAVEPLQVRGRAVA